jgi:hypothetical protein
MLVAPLLLLCWGCFYIDSSRRSSPFQVRAGARVCVRACMRACPCGCARARVCGRACACVTRLCAHVQFLRSRVLRTKFTSAEDLADLRRIRAWAISKCPSQETSTHWCACVLSTPTHPSTREYP